MKDSNKEGWVWGFGKTYGVDFYNPYVDFGEFSLRLPGFHLPIMKYWDGQGLRYVSFFFLLFSLFSYLFLVLLHLFRTGGDSGLAITL